MLNNLVKPKKNISMIRLRGCCAIICLLFMLFPFSAIIAQSILVTDGKVYMVKAIKETYQDFTLPKQIPFDQFNLEARGADGGWVEYTFYDRFNAAHAQRVKGGEGATISASYSIGRNEGQIAPGSILRLIIGNRGRRAKLDLPPQGGLGAGAGGGTAILLSKDGGTSWQILMVAGGGGGAAVYATHDETKFSHGLPASSDVRGVGGGRLRNVAAGGTEEQGGNFSETTGGGGGTYQDGRHERGTLYYGNAGWKEHKLHGQPLGGLGGTQEDCRNGGWGFGGGGSGAKGGGGGGGYAGGGAGTPGHGGGGGGSFVEVFKIKPANIQKKQNGDTNNPGDGYVRYQFVKRPGK